jgi:hypothetical protein
MPLLPITQDKRGILIPNATLPTYDSAYPGGDRPGGGGSGITLSMSMALTTAGRVGFWADYSELTEAGTHRFYIQRTHGTVGAIAVSYQSYGDTHIFTSGTLNWADGEADIKYVDVPTGAKTVDGEHRIYLQLSNPTNGAVLHFGDYTVAYGGIDDGTIAADSDAVFFDVDAVSNGIGTQASPYDNIYDAIANVGATKRYIYGKGTVVPDGTDMVGPYGTKVKGVAVPATRTGESDRLIVRNWPGFTLTLDGGAQDDVCGFFGESDESYQTFKGITFNGMDTTLSDNPCWGVWYHYGTYNTKSNNVEHCSFTNFDGGAGENHAGVNPYGTQGCKVWRCTFDTIAHEGDTSNNNTGGVITYDGQYISVQRCEFSNMRHGTFQKRIRNLNDVSINAKFNLFNDTDAHYAISGASGQSHAYTIIAHNLFVGTASGGITHDTENNALLGTKNMWSSNVFDSCGSGEIAAINAKLANGAIMFNNIMLDCRKVLSDYINEPLINWELADYQHHFGTTLPSQMYEYRGTNYASIALFNSGTGFAANDLESDPLFTNTVGGDYTLQGGSPAIGTGAGGTNKGIYLTGLEVLGA